MLIFTLTMRSKKMACAHCSAIASHVSIVITAALNQIAAGDKKKQWKKGGTLFFQAALSARRRRTIWYILPMVIIHIWWCHGSSTSLMFSSWYIKLSPMSSRRAHMWICSQHLRYWVLVNINNCPLLYALPARVCPSFPCNTVVHCVRAWPCICLIEKSVAYAKKIINNHLMLSAECDCRHNDSCNEIIYKILRRKGIGRGTTMLCYIIMCKLIDVRICVRTAVFTTTTKRKHKKNKVKKLAQVRAGRVCAYWLCIWIGCGSRSVLAAATVYS